MGDTSIGRPSVPGPRTTPLFVIPGFKGPIKTILNSLFNAGMNLVSDLFADVLGNLLTPSPSQLQHLESIYQTSMGVYFLLIGIFGLSTLGYFQLFPDDEKTDPVRFLRRATPATLSLWIVNPPGWSSNLFSQGAYAWAMAVTNQIIEVYLGSMSSVNFQSSSVADAMGGPFVLLAFVTGYQGIIIILELLLFLGLVLRQTLLFMTYGIYPLLIAFWVADAGVLKYGKKTAMKLFKTTATLMVGGILIAAVFAIGLDIIANSGQIFAGGTPPSPSTTTGTTAAFSTGQQADVLFTVSLKMLMIGIMCILPLLMIKQMLGAVGAAAASAVSTAVTIGVGVVTGGTGSVVTSGAAAAAKAGGKAAAKKGVKKGVKSVASKGVKGAAKTAAKKAPAAAKTAGTKAAQRAPEAARKAGRGAVEGGRSAARRGVDEAFAGTGGGIPQEEDQANPEQGASGKSASQSRGKNQQYAKRGADRSQGTNGSTLDSVNSPGLPSSLSKQSSGAKFENPTIDKPKK